MFIVRALSAEDILGVNDNNFIFQQDGAPCHTAKVCSKWYADNAITILDQVTVPILIL